MARAHFLYLSFSKKCHFSKNAQKSKSSCARAWWRAPQKFYKRARLAFFFTPQKFWRARALTCDFIEKIESLPPPNKKSHFLKIQMMIFLARARQKFQNLKFQKFWSWFFGFLNILVWARAGVSKSMIKVCFFPKNGLKISSAGAQKFLRARQNFWKIKNFDNFNICARGRSKKYPIFMKIHQFEFFFNFDDFEKFWKNSYGKSLLKIVRADF